MPNKVAAAAAGTSAAGRRGDDGIRIPQDQVHPSDESPIETRLRQLAQEAQSLVSPPSSPRGQKNQLGDHLDSSSSSRPVEVNIVPEGHASQPPAFLDRWTHDGLPERVNVWIESDRSVVRNYQIKIEVPSRSSKAAQDSEQAVWSFTEQLELLKDQPVLEKLCRYEYVDNRYGTTSSKFGVAKQEFEKQIQEGDGSSLLSRRVRISAVSADIYGGISYGAFDDAVVEMLATAFHGKSSAFFVDLKVQCQAAQSDNDSSSSSPVFTDYSMISVNLQKVEVDEYGIPKTLP
ncbi:unnamed protein product [Amoebophrya sp. A25]|nr:unnamed protein product [Amoebophrya sp. A25]|eukprot:GSA25T00019302001.1